MKVIETLTPCRCRECNGAEKLTQIVLIAESEADLESLVELSEQLRGQAEAKGGEIVSVQIGDAEITPGRRKADAARNN